MFKAKLCKERKVDGIQLFELLQFLPGLIHHSHFGSESAFSIKYTALCGHQPHTNPQAH